MGQIVLDYEVTMVDVASFQVLVELVETILFGHLKLKGMYLLEYLAADFVDLLCDLFLQFLELRGYFFNCFLEILVESKLTDFELFEQCVKVASSVWFVILLLKLLKVELQGANQVITMVGLVLA